MNSLQNSLKNSLHEFIDSCQFTVWLVAHIYVCVMCIHFFPAEKLTLSHQAL